jgi:hypothetical protein
MSEIRQFSGTDQNKINQIYYGMLKAVFYFKWYYQFWPAISKTANAALKGILYSE